MEVKAQALAPWKGDGKAPGLELGYTLTFSESQTQICAHSCTQRQTHSAGMVCLRERSPGTARLLRGNCLGTVGWEGPELTLPPQRAACPSKCCPRAGPCAS